MSPMDPNCDLRAAVQRDAARVQEPPFDAALHQATMRQIRALPDGGKKRSVPRWKLAVASCAALLLGWGGASVLVRREREPMQPEAMAAIASTERAIANLALEPAAPLPAWMSPTAALLEPPEVWR